MYSELKNPEVSTTAATRRKILEPGNIALGLTVILIIGLLIYGDTLIKIPRYYAIEIWNEGQKEWVFMEEGYARDEDDKKGEANAYWEPPCVADEDFPEDKKQDTDLVFDSYVPATKEPEYKESEMPTPSVYVYQR